MIRAVIFDCFGVIVTDALQVVCDELLDSDPTLCRQVKDIVKAANLGLMPAEESNRQIAGLLGITPAAFRGRISDGEIKDSRLMDFIAGLRGRYKTAMLSNIAGSSLRDRFTSEELTRCFDAVVVSGDIGFAKPEPEAYEIAADRLDVRLDECVFIDDREHFCDAARAVGMRAIPYRSFGQFRGELEALLAA